MRSPCGQETTQQSATSRAAEQGAAPRPEYTAFRALYRERYLRYALARMGRRRGAGALVQGVFEELAAHWPEVLRSPSPAALAWGLLTARLNGTRGASAAELLRARLPEGTADAVLLCQMCGMTAEEAADVMGVEVSSVTSRLGMAHRTLSTMTGPEARSYE